MTWSIAGIERGWVKSLKIVVVMACLALFNSLLTRPEYTSSHYLIILLTGTDWRMCLSKRGELPQGRLQLCYDEGMLGCRARNTT